IAERFSSFLANPSRALSVIARKRSGLTSLTMRSWILCSSVRRAYMSRNSFSKSAPGNTSPTTSNTWSVPSSRRISRRRSSSFCGDQNLGGLFELPFRVNPRARHVAVADLHAAVDLGEGQAPLPEFPERAIVAAVTGEIVEGVLVLREH